MVGLWWFGICSGSAKTEKQDVVFFCFTHCSKVRRLRLALEVKDKRRVSKGSRSQDSVLDLYRKRQKIGRYGR